MNYDDKREKLSELKKKKIFQMQVGYSQKHQNFFVPYPIIYYTILTTKKRSYRF